MLQFFIVSLTGPWRFAELIVAASTADRAVEVVKERSPEDFEGASPYWQIVDPASPVDWAVPAEGLTEGVKFRVDCIE